MRIAILSDNKPVSSSRWESACKRMELTYSVINILRSDWLAKLMLFDPTFCVCRPPGDLLQNKRVFDEKLYYLEKYTRYKVFPGYDESVVYENKASLAYFLEVNNIPGPKTFVSYSLTESNEFVNRTVYPIVAKTFLGAAGSGVRIIRSKTEARNYVRVAFHKGIKRRYGPNRKTGSPQKWISKAFKSPSYFFQKLSEYKERNNDVQKGAVLFQEFIPHDFEWRCVKIGESYFAYKKIRIGLKASGSKKFDYGAPPEVLLDFTRNLCLKFGFNFMAIDLFFNSQGIFVNELQTIFGHKNPYICKVNEKPGRFLYQDSSWIFEEGDFNTNESYDLRLSEAIKLYNNI